ncbi:MAG TPA: NADH-quinone oxidoreductase subunit N [Gemmatales bacterium]|nr:NADH-quinone oxidoreductase subunit N [Gemmatales bacterium]
MPLQLDFLATPLLHDLAWLAPELLLVLGMAVLLIARLFPSLDRWQLGFVPLLACFLALLVASLQWFSFLVGNTQAVEKLFSGQLVFDGLAAFSRMILYGAAGITILITLLTKIPDREDSADFHVLLLGATVGMALMTMAYHLLMVYLAVEMASVPSYVLAGFLKGKRQGSEAALKYVVYGGAASGLLLYGISLMAGRLGTGYLPDVSLSLLTILQADGLDMLWWLTLGFILLGLAFKLSLVPMHFWCPDVFAGATAEVGGFLSVASKAAALVLTGRWLMMLMGQTTEVSIHLAAASQQLAPGLSFIIVVVAAVTCTWGNLAAYPQTELKRFWAYSTIAHAGLLVMPLATLTREGLAASLVYLVPYTFMNLGVFAIVCFVRNFTHRETIEAFAGLGQRSRSLAISLAILVIGLIGLPPLAGFMAKYEVFAVLYQEAQQQKSLQLYFLLGVAVMNTLLSLGYYGRLLKVAWFEVPSSDFPMIIPFRQKLFAALLAGFAALGNAFWDALTIWGSHIAVAAFQPLP